MKIFFVLITLMVFSFAARAEVTLLDKDNWKVTMSGFAEFDTTYDTVRGFSEVVGNSPVATDSYSANTHSFQTSVRNSRLAFGVQAPTMNGWKTLGYIETDFLGANYVGQSEASTYNNAYLRIRHLFLQAEKDGWQVLTGQTWSLFGWQSTFVPSTISVAPVSGILYERTAQASLMRAVDMGENQKLKTALAISRPAERDSGTPSLDAGLKWSMGSRKSALYSTYGDAQLQPLTLALSGTLRRYSAPTSATSLTSHNTLTGGAVAADILVPLLAADESGSIANTLTLTGEFSAGKGYGDEFPNWSGDLRALSSGTAGQPNLDAGIGGFDSSGNFQLVMLQSWNVQLQYHITETSTVDAGYATLHSSNVGQLAPTNGTLYNRSSTCFANYLRDITKQWRVGAEFDVFQTKYIDGENPADRRIMVASLYRF